MATYCFKCPDCGTQRTSTSRDIVPECDACWDMYPCSGPYRPMIRDYRAENVAPATVQLARERERGGRSAVRDLFLPTAKDFEGPSDPDGTKGIRQWADEHGPREGNSKPLYPEMPKKVF